MVDRWDMRLRMDPEIPVLVDVDYEFVGPNADRMRSFLSS